MATIDERIQQKLKQDKINLIKDIAAGKIEPDVAKYLLDLLKKEDRCVRLVYSDDHDGRKELLPEYQAIKDLHDKIPDRFKNMFYTVEIDEQDLGIGAAI